MRLVQVSTPSVEPMATDEVSVAQGWIALIDPAADFLGQLWDVLCVFDDGDSFLVFVGRNAAETLEHLVAGDDEAALVVETVGKDRAPRRMRVKDGADVWQLLGEDAVKHRFGGGLAGIVAD